MTTIYYYVLAIIFLGAGIPLTYFGYENGVKDAESGDSNDAGYTTMMVFGILFIVISVVFAIIGAHRTRKERLQKS